MTDIKARQRYDYNPDTGAFTYIRSGKQAGKVDRNGYRRVMVKGKRLNITKIIWLMTYGELPTDMVVDHIDHDKDNNKICNLRLITKAENLRNKTKQHNNKSGVTGVIWNKSANKWQAYISHNKRIKHLGLYVEKEDAVKVRKEAEKIADYHINHGLLKNEHL